MKFCRHRLWLSFACKCKLIFVFRHIMICMVYGFGNVLKYTHYWVLHVQLVVITLTVSLSVCVCVCVCVWFEFWVCQHTLGFSVLACLKLCFVSASVWRILIYKIIAPFTWTWSKLKFQMNHQEFKCK